MDSLEKVDKNFKVDTNIDKEDIVFYDVLDVPFDVRGVFFENGKFRRIPETVAKSVSKGVYFLHTHTSGGRVRFKTNSPYVAISAKMDGIGKRAHFAMAGSTGFDLYIKNKDKFQYYKTFMPPVDIKDGYEGIVEFNSTEYREITINFPLYTNVCGLYIGVSNKAEVSAPCAYKNEKKIVYYGSSITQGACASRPGNSYQGMIERKFDCDYINLGFSGSAMAEKEIVDYIAGLEMDVFVYDYDYNAPTNEHLQNTHSVMFKAIRKTHPSLPIIIMSRPKLFLTKEEDERLSIIKNTYDNAKNAGDSNVYFIPGEKLMAMTNNDGTVDDVHPNDLGFYSMTEALSEILKKIL